MDAPSPHELSAWLRTQGLDPDRIVIESVQGYRTDVGDRLSLTFVEAPSTANDAYCARTAIVAMPPWLGEHPARHSDGEAVDAAEEISPQERTVMSEHLREWMHD